MPPPRAGAFDRLFSATSSRRARPRAGAGRGRRPLVVEDARDDLGDEAGVDVDQHGVRTVADPLIAVRRHWQVVVPIVVDPPVGCEPSIGQDLTIEPSVVVPAGRSAPEALAPMEPLAGMEDAREPLGIVTRALAAGLEPRRAECGMEVPALRTALVVVLVDLRIVVRRAALVVVFVDLRLIGVRSALVVV